MGPAAIGLGKLYPCGMNECSWSIGRGSACLGNFANGRASRAARTERIEWPYFNLDSKIPRLEK